MVLSPVLNLLPAAFRSSRWLPTRRRCTSGGYLRADQCAACIGEQTGRLKAWKVYTPLGNAAAISAAMSMFQPRRRNMLIVCLAGGVAVHVENVYVVPQLLTTVLLAQGNV
jgi:hypothetical protein